jgi:serine/threonine protein kinase
MKPTTFNSRPARPAHRSDDLGVDGDVPCGSAAERLGIDLAREMRRHWRAGERIGAEEFLSRRPEVSQSPQAAVELIYEEYCLRQAAGEDGVEQDLLNRFPQWAGPLRVMLECHRQLLESQRDVPRFPAAGDDMAGFRLLDELGRGSRGRVFLAEQTALAGRRVVLKIAPLDRSDAAGEHLSLARLQHTNIVPLYSAADDARRRVRVLCMPYFGRATLASLLETVAGVPPGARTGGHVLAAIDRVRDPSSATATLDDAAPAPSGAVRQMLASVSFVQAMCWITASLADALQFAHERGVLHLDLKPSNVLLARDGQPMLLDFHLARGPVAPGAAPPENFGGTAPYMPPEQEAVLRSVRDGRPVAVAVDARADLYALGAMVYEALGGQLPVTEDSPRLERINPQASAGLSDVVARCVARRPEDRYADAAGLADDLRRHLTDRPLAGVANRSMDERWRKWRRRRPASLRVVGVMALLMVVAGVGAAGVASHLHDRHAQASLALHDGQRQLRTDPGSAEAAHAFQRGLDLLANLPFETDLRRQLADHLVSARRLQLVGQLHRLADEVRVLYGNTETIEPTRLSGLASQCGALWERREVLVDALAPTQDPQVATDLKDVAIFAASLCATRPETLHFLDEAEEMFGPSAVLQHERGRRNEGPAPSTAWEHYALGRAFLKSGELSRAAAELEAARQLDPGGRWANFYYGVCAYRVGRYDDAITAFSVCIGTAPDVAAGYYNRALAYAALGQDQQAARDLDRAAQIDPSCAGGTALNRATSGQGERSEP